MSDLARSILSDPRATEQAKAAVRAALTRPNRQMPRRDLPAARCSEATRAVVIDIPMRTVNGQNAREHHFARAQRVKRERTNAYYSLKATILPALPVTVTFHRTGKQIMDGDGFIASAKSIRDGVADAYGLADDSDPRIEWKYGEQTKEKKVGVRIVIARKA